MILLVPSYVPKDKHRVAEIAQALTLNLENEYIDEVRVFAEDSPESHREMLESDHDGVEMLKEAFEHQKVRVIPLGKRVTHESLISYANAKLSGRRVCYANADVHFDETLGLLRERDLRGSFLCLAKWENERLHSPAGSQDAWIFEAPIPALVAPWKFGVGGTDNKIAHAAHEASLKTVNPCHSVILHHLHNSDGKPVSYAERYPAPWREVPESDLSCLPLKAVTS